MYGLTCTELVIFGLVSYNLTINSMISLAVSQSCIDIYTIACSLTSYKIIVVRMHSHMIQSQAFPCIQFNSRIHSAL